MKKKTFVVQNRDNRGGGLHAVPSSITVSMAALFECDIILTSTDGRYANAKSIMGIMALALPRGNSVELSCNGIDEDEAFSAMCELLEATETDAMKAAVRKNWRIKE